MVELQHSGIGFAEHPCARASDKNEKSTGGRLRDAVQYDGIHQIRGRSLDVPVRFRIVTMNSGGSSWSRSSCESEGNIVMNMFNA